MIDAERFEALQLLVLPWAKEAEPDKYAQTLAVAGRRETFTNYLLRLLELRWAADPAVRGTVPLWLLEETRIVQRFRARETGQEFEVAGRKIEGRAVGWGMLALAMEAAEPGVAFRDMLHAISTFDLSVASIQEGRR